MGCYPSSPAHGAEIRDEMEASTREIERQIKEAKMKMSRQIKVLLLGSGDSGKSSILKQMRLLHNMPFSQPEIESYRQLVFENVVRGLRVLLDFMDDFEIKVLEENIPNTQIIDNAGDVTDGEPFPRHYIEPLKALWADPNVQRAYRRGNERALPENLSYFFSDLDRLFRPNFRPTEQDIVRCRARTIGIIETTFPLGDKELLVVDVGGQKSERRKWIHCFQDVVSIIYLASLNGYDQCLVEDKDANQMQDALTIWDSLSHSQWFTQATFILFLNKDDLFEKKVPVSDIKPFFPDYEGAPGDVQAGRDYFKRRFAIIAHKAGLSKEREVYIHITTATDTAMLRAVIAAAEG